MKQFLTLCVGVVSIANAFSTKQRDSTIEIFRKRNFVVSEEQQATDHAEDFCEEIGENGIFEDPQNCSSVFFCGGDGKNDPDNSFLSWSSSSSVALLNKYLILRNVCGPVTLRRRDCFSSTTCRMYPSILFTP